MPTAAIPESVKRLIASSIDSVPELEAILLLRQDKRAWTSIEAGERLYVSTTVAAHVLATLCERGFLARDGDAFCWHPESAELDMAVDELARAYSRHLVEVTRLIHSKPPAGVREFADAFRLRRDK